jgi:hypothetical protein
MKVTNTPIYRYAVCIRNYIYMPWLFMHDITRLNKLFSRLSFPPPRAPLSQTAGLMILTRKLISITQTRVCTAA